METPLSSRLPASICPVSARATLSTHHYPVGVPIDAGELRSLAGIRCALRQDDPCRTTLLSFRKEQEQQERNAKFPLSR